MSNYTENMPFVNNNMNSSNRSTVHIPLCDVDDLPFKNRQDPNFIASITNLMQVPASITLTNGHSNNPQQRSFYDNSATTTATFAMDIPEKLTADGIIKNRSDSPPVSNDSMFEDLRDNDIHDTTATPPSTPTQKMMSFLDANMDQDQQQQFSKTPQVSADLFNRMRPRRSSIELDLHAEIRILRDKVNYLEHECQVNSRSCRIFYAILFGYVFVKSFTWMVNK